MRALLAVLLLLTLAFAGCASKGGGGDDEPSTSGSQTATGTSAGSGTASGTRSTSGSSTASGTSGPGNQPPTGGIAAAINGTAVAFNLTGADPDGDSLSWNLTFGDGQSTDGTALPASLTHSYPAGAFTANFTVSDGKTSTVRNVTVTISAGPAGVGQTVSVDWAFGTPFVGCFADWLYEMPNYPEELDGIAYASFDIVPTSIGLPFMFEITSDAEMDSPGLTMLDAAGGLVYNSLTNDGVTEVPEGAAKGYFYTCAGAQMHATYTSG